MRGIRQSQGQRKKPPLLYTLKLVIAEVEQRIVQDHPRENEFLQAATTTPKHENRGKSRN
jgi:hypothetical protein